MATIQELSNIKQTTQAPMASPQRVSASSGIRISEKKTIDTTSALLKDIASFGQQAVKAKFDASEYTGKRVGIDNFVEFKKGLLEIDNLYSDKPMTPADYVKKSKEEQALYETYTAKGHFGDNEVANQAFVDNFVSPATEMVLKRRTANNKDRVTAIQDETTKDTKNAINILGPDIRGTNIATFKERYRNNGLNENDVDVLVLDSINTQIESSIKEHHSAFYDAAGNIKENAVQEFVEEMYNGLGKNYLSSDSAYVQSNIAKYMAFSQEKIKAKAEDKRREYFQDASNFAERLRWTGPERMDQDGNVYKFATPKEYEANLREKFPLLDKQSFETLMNDYKKKTGDKKYPLNTQATEFINATKRDTKTAISNNTEINPKLYENIKNGYNTLVKQNEAGHISDEKLIAAKNIIDNINMYVGQLQEVQGLVKSNNPDLSKYAAYGKTDKNGRTITSDMFKSVIKNRIGAIQGFVDDIKYDGNTQEDQVKTTSAFNASLNEIKSLTLKSGSVQVPYFAKFKDMLSTTKGRDTMGIDDLHKLVMYSEWALASGDNAFVAYKNDISELKNILATTDSDGKLLDKNSRLSQARAKLNSITADIMISKNNSKRLGNIEKAITRVYEGEGWTDVIDTDMPYKTSSILAQILPVHLKEEAEIAEWIADNTLDVGATFGWDKYRLIKPSGIGSSKEFEKYTNAIVDNYNKKMTSDIDWDDIELYAEQDGDDVAYRVKYKNKVLGRISSNGYQIVKGLNFGATDQLDDAKKQNTDLSDELLFSIMP